MQIKTSGMQMQMKNAVPSWQKPSVYEKGNYHLLLKKNHRGFIQG